MVSKRNSFHEPPHLPSESILISMFFNLFADTYITHSMNAASAGLVSCAKGFPRIVTRWLPKLRRCIGVSRSGFVFLPLILSRPSSPSGT